MELQFKMRKLKKTEIDKAVENMGWQSIRKWLKGKSLNTKIKMLNTWYKMNQGTMFEKEVEVQVINYINALKRAGMVKK